MWVRYNTAPWWCRWLIITAWMTVWLVLFYWAMLPRGHWSTPWPAWITAVALIALGSLIAAPITRLGQPTVNSYSAVLQGLTSAQRTEVGRALRRGPIPTDPAVLGAAARAIDLSRAYRDRVTPGRRRAVWVMIAIFGVVLPVLQFVGDRPAMGVLYLTAGVTMFVSEVVPTYLRRRRGPYLAQLRAAADADPEAAAVAADSVSPAVPTVRERLMQAGLLVAVVIPASAGAVFVSSAAEQDCRIANSVIRDIAEHRELLDATRIGPGGPALDEYRGWVQRMQRRADQVSDPAIKQHLHDIAGLSGVAVIVVGQAREPGVSSVNLVGFQTHYGNLMRSLIDADKNLAQVCS